MRPSPLAVALSLSGALAAQAPSYTRDVRPILSKNCFACHGPDDAHRKAKLRLDRPGAKGLRHVLERITTSNRKQQMPPPASGKSLTGEQIAILRRWLAAGAPYERHWAFVPPQRPQVPTSKHQHPVDRFIAERLAKNGMRLSPEADRRTLIRRVSLDLIGLPPTPTEVQAFLADTDDGAYERLVDRLLASPHYGERWARKWLDLARYADTNGYEKDRNRSIWPYRDWVIRAINADLPFDQFAVEQLAGDMLPNATTDQRIATGFHRNTMLNEEGGIDPLEFRFHAMTDRVATTGTVFLGLTVGCAQCHTHKFDPITHDDYYGMMAFLNNADEPDFVVPNPKDATARRDRRARANALLRDLPGKWPKQGPSLAQRFSAWLGTRREQTAAWKTLDVAEATSNLPLLTKEDDGSVFVSGDITKHDVYHLRLRGAAHTVRALRLEALPDERLPDGGPGLTYYEGTKGDFFLTELTVRKGKGGAKVRIAKATHSYSKNRFGRNPAGADLALDGDLQTGWSVHGRMGERHVAVFTFAEPIPAGQELAVEMHFGRHYSSSLGRFRIAATADPRDGQASGLSNRIEGLLRREDAELTDAERAELQDAFLLQAKEVSKAAKPIHDLRRRRRPTTTLVLQERPRHHPRLTRRHHRGEYLQPRETIAPRTPEVLHSYPDAAPKNRLGFAKWLIAPDNPLFARVTVNRQWAALFGRGLVTTVDDFGAQGALPSHPRLLDWLAVEFRDSGYRRKQLHRLLVTSATYRQRSHVTSEHLAKDPENRWLARAPRLRLEGEVIRDAALRAAGVLTEKMFGPPVRPVQPPGITEVAFGRPRWNPSKGPDRFRRSIYTFMKRTAPYAFTQTFDAPSGEACIARRDVSNTALQALSLLNDPMMLEVARAFGHALAQQGRKPDAEVLTHAFERILARPPSATERAALTAFLQQQRRRFTAAPKAAAQAAGTKANAIERAAWTALARTLLSLDEAITRN